jgi:transposase
VAARTSIERVIEFLKAELGDSDAEVAAHVRCQHAELAAALASVPCIGAAGVACMRKLRACSTPSPAMA